MKFPWSRTEIRQSDGEQDKSYTDRLVDLLLAAAIGTAVNGKAQQTAAAEFGLALLSRCIAQARVSPEIPALSPTMLATLARTLLLTGNAVYDIDVDPREGISLSPAMLWDVEGSVRPETWVYQLELSGPSMSEGRRRPNESVLHFRINADNTQPWLGRSAFLNAGLTTAMLATLETRITEEAGARAGTLLPVPDTLSDEALEALRGDLRALAGQIALVETTSAGLSTGRANAPHQDWQPKRFGANIPEGNINMRNNAARDVLAAIGVPPILWEGGDGASMREAYRELLVATIEPLGSIIEEELSRKFEFDVKLTFGRLAAADIAARARAYHSLIMADPDYDKEEAKRISGLLD